MLDQLTPLPAALGKIEHLLTDNGFYSAANAATCEAHDIEPLMTVGRESHHPGPFERFCLFHHPQLILRYDLLPLL